MTSDKTPDKHLLRSGDHRLDAVPRLLDHQILGPGGEMLGNVDDLELTDREGTLAVTALVIGPGGLARRLPGRLGTWTGAIWRRLCLDADPQPVRVAIEHITEIGSAVTVDDAAAAALVNGAGLELWLRRYVISRIPGAKGTSAQTDPEKAAVSQKESRRDSSHSGAHPRVSPFSVVYIGTLIGASVRDHDDHEVGKVCELRCVGRSPNRRQLPLTVTHMQYTRHLAGSESAVAPTLIKDPLLSVLWSRDGSAWIESRPSTR